MSVLEHLRPKLGRLLSEKPFVRRDSPEHVTHQILEGLFQDRTLRNLNVRLWDGTMWPDATARAATLVLNRPSALREMLMGGARRAWARRT
ncbi:MAG: hypothetical protein LV479_10680 [Methylacidiphilales bacterium]|nr:hypothetical protein [Candidatus Methylacidiphilales bacterium]